MAPQKTTPKTAGKKATAKKSPAGGETTGSAKEKRMPTYDEINKRAHEIYLERGCGPGNPDDDWAKAEADLIKKFNS